MNWGVKDAKGKFNDRNKMNGSAERLPGLDGELDFASKEAFNRLRTNLMLSFTDSSKARIIGVSSSVRGEGKSFVSCCIAHSLSETGNKVLLLEGDLRLPTVAKKLNIKKAPGLSNILTGSINDVVDALQQRAYGKLDVITSGDIPPNPSELLGSQRMKSLIGILSENYDYIVFDLPPVTSVPDPLIVTQLISGIVLVVRHEYTDKKAVEETIRQLKIANAKVLGFVYNGNDGSGGSYSKKYYKKRKYSKYYSEDYSSGNKKK
ncbi:MAG: CpsD/CapB family tyrosine-protein kinase [Ruminococcus sp.]|nr:CpsD/CapB family tyrosine-protein kinase [Ruminococcus sp.]